MHDYGFFRDWPDMRDASLGERIKFAYERRKAEVPTLTYEALAQLVGITRSAVAQWFASDPEARTEPDRSRLTQIAMVLDCPRYWLMTGTPYAKGTGPIDSEAQRFLEVADNVSLEAAIQDVKSGYSQRVSRRVPVISWVAASQWGDTADPYPVGQGQDFEQMTGVSPKAFILRVDGPSMEPEVREGSYIVVEPELAWQSGDFVVAKLEGEGADVAATFKQIVQDGGSLWLRPMNPQFPSLPVTDKVHIVGVVTRDFRRRK